MSVVKAEDIAHVRFAAPDLAAMRTFLEAFGLTCEAGSGGRLFARGDGPAPFAHVTEPGEPRFLALGLRAASLADLERLAAAEGAFVEDFDAPGGGKLVRLVDPDGVVVEVVAGQAMRPDCPARVEAPRNDAGEKRRLRSFVRLSPGPSHVHRLGHCVLAVADFPTTEAWYKARFGFLTSDEFAPEPGRPIGAFLRCDRGEAPSDHHTLALVSVPGRRGFMHAGFEVADVDDLMLGHSHLRSTGRYAHVRGVGRHILGSQVFDYWNDPFGAELEHWTDGDLLTAADPPAQASLQDLTGVQWGAAFAA